MYTDAIAHHGVRQPHAAAVVFDRAELTYRQFDDHIDAVARRLAEACRPGDRVGVVCANPYLHWLVVLALGRLPVVSVSVGASGAVQLLPHAGATLVVAEAGVTVPEHMRLERVSLDWVDQAVAAAAGQQPARRPLAADAPARIVMSSGTTGRPKKILFTHEHLVRRMKTGMFGDVPPPGSRLLSGLGIDSLGGFGAPMSTWWSGGAVAMFRPEPTLMAGRRLTHLVASPLQLRKLVSEIPPDFAPLAQLQITVGGGRMGRALKSAVQLRLSPLLSIGYGSTETGPTARCPAGFSDRVPFLAGIGLPFVELEAVDEAGRPLPPGERGEIRVRCPDMVHSYLDDTEATRTAFRDGWFYPGDFGAVSAGRALRIFGRVDEVLNLGGLKIAPEAIESVLAAQQGVTDVGAFSLMGAGGIERPWAAVVVTDAFDPAAARAAVRARISLAELRLGLLKVDAIPRNAMGKIQRFHLKQLAVAANAGTAGAQPA